MRRTAKALPARNFQPPNALHRQELCRLSYRQPLDDCPTYVEYFKEGDEVPSGLCPIHSGSLKQRAERAVQGVLGAIGRGIRGIFR
jgi:hypothetical protein